MKKILSVILSVMLIVSFFCVTGTRARAATPEKVFQVEKPLLLFDMDGLSVTLTGGIVMLDMTQTFPAPVDLRAENASIALTAVAQNLTDKDLYIEYSGTVNNISLSGNHPMINMHKLAAGSRNALYIVFQKEWLNGKDLLTLESCNLVFHVYEKKTDLNQDNTLLYDIPAGIIRFDQGRSVGMSFRDGDSLTILDRDGLKIDAVSIQVSKGSQYLLVGTKVQNNTGKTIRLSSSARINGWDTGGYRNTPLGKDGKSAESIKPGSTELIMINMISGWNKIRSNAELESVEMIFEVSEVDGGGNKTLMFSESTGKIWINREPGEATEEAGDTSVAAEPAPAAAAQGASGGAEPTPKAAAQGAAGGAEPTATAEAQGATGGAEPTPTVAAEDQKGFRLMYDLEFGDDLNTVKAKAKAAGATLSQESGALHGKADWMNIPYNSYDFLFSNGKMNRLRSMNMLSDISTSSAEAVYLKYLDQMVEFFGEPNGRGKTEKKQSTIEMVTEETKALLPGVYFKSLKHNEWYIPDAKPYPLKIDLYFSDLGNKEANTQGYAVELEIEARGL